MGFFKNPFEKKPVLSAEDEELLRRNQEALDDSQGFINNMRQEDRDEKQRREEFLKEKLSGLEGMKEDDTNLAA